MTIAIPTAGETFEARYTNWRGQTAVRRLQAINLWFGVTEWHPEPQWLLRAADLDREAVRDFALKDMEPV